MCARAEIKLNGVKCTAFPGISTGVYRYPKDQACKIAIETTKAFLEEHPEIEKVIFVCFSEEDLAIYQKTFGDMR